MSDERDDAKRAFLRPWIERAAATLVDGVATLKYFRHPQAETIENDLLRAIDVLESMTGSKDDIKRAADSVDDTIDLACFCFAETIGGAWSIAAVDVAFEPKGESAAMKDYRRRVAKALENKQKHAPGFDGQGGGRARGATTSE